MIIPKYWAEGRARHRGKGRQITARRFGWSNLSQEEAQALADKRAKEALERLLSGDKLPSRESKVSYNGAEGVPIREEVVAEKGTSVITRNIYGALCLNTPDVLFADVDLPTGPGFRQSAVTFLLLVLAAIGLGVSWHSRPLGLVAVLAALFLGTTVSRLFYRLRLAAFGTEEKQAMKRVASFLISNPSWSIRVYQTPAGLRLLVEHRKFAPNEPEVLAFFQAIGTDRRYVAMCLNQRCFRARLTPKPWRIGIPDHVKPRPGVWPINPERMTERRAWVARYEQASLKYSACRYIVTLGSGVVDAGVEAVQKVHDQEARAASNLPIA